MKKCPFCAEEIQDEAIKCRFCGEMLETPKSRVEPRLATVKCPYCGAAVDPWVKTCRCGGAIPQHDSPDQQREESKSSGCMAGIASLLIGCGIVSGVVVFVGWLSLSDEARRNISIGEAESALPADEQSPYNSGILERYKILVRAVEIKSKVLVIDGFADETSGDIRTVKLTVSNLWHSQPYQVRLQMAQGLWQTWANVASPSDLDKARISLVDTMGNEVGGSRWLAGSMIWVKE